MSEAKLVSHRIEVNQVALVSQVFKRRRTMKKVIVMLVWTLLIVGCAFSTKMVNDKGVVVDCRNVGVGPITGAAAMTNRDNCVNRLKAQGYHEVE
jgi:hypothetical protein